MQENQKPDNQANTNPEKTDTALARSDNAIISEISASYSGPLPPPKHFEKYEQTLPGSADRILTMAENEQINRNTWESINQQSRIGREKRGQWMGFVVALLCIFGAISLAAYGHQWPAIF